MCETCGCGDPEVVPVDVQQSLLADNDHRAAHNREHLRARGAMAFNLMGSPGSGKTALLEATARAWPDRRLAAASGDLATDRDAERLRRAGIPSVSITTGQACHLDARLVHGALHDLHDADFEFLFVENVGNLVCPAIYDVGQERNVVLVSVTEGEDKPLKYPVMFRKADLVVITKVDLLPALGHFDVSALRENLSQVMPDPRCVLLSTETGEGVDAWIAWLEGHRRRVEPDPRSKDSSPGRQPIPAGRS